MRAVRFHEYGDESMLRVEEVPDPQPGEGEVLVGVAVAGTNPGEAAIRSGGMRERFPARFPEGQGSDLSGMVLAVGDGVRNLAIGEPVIGLSDGRNAQAELVVLPQGRVVRKPESLGWDVAATLYVAGTTALAVLQTVPVDERDTLVVAGAAGGVGVFLTQLAVGAGARVVAIAGEANADWLRAHGAEPVAHGDDLEARLRDLVPDGPTAFADLHGDGYADLAVRLGVPPDRVDTIADFDAPQRLGVHAEGMSALRDPTGGVAQLAAIASQGGFEVPIKARHPLDDVQQAYRDLGRRSGLGKVVLHVADPS